LDRLRASTSHVALALAEAGLIAMLAVGLIAGTAFAAKGGHSGNSTSSSFIVNDGAFAATTLAHGGTGTWAHAKCYQDGTLVYEQYLRYATDGTATLTLGPTPMWASGAASCVGEDGWWQDGSRWRINATDAFTVAA
jgi:hypothetical protein